MGVGIVPGAGVVVRCGTAIGVFDPGAGPDEPFTSAWLHRLSRWGAGDTAPAEALARQAADLLMAHRASAPAWGSAVRAGNGYLVLVHGDVRAQIDVPAGRIEARGVPGIMHRWFADPIHRIALSLATSGDIVADPTSDLQTGPPTTGSGLVLTSTRWPRPAPVASPPSGPMMTRSMAPPDGTPVGAPPARPSVGDPAPQIRIPRSPAAPAPDPAPATAHRVIDAPHPPPVVPAPSTVVPMMPVVAPVPPPGPPVAGRSPSEETQTVQVTAGMLVADDGTRTILDREYVLGRDPGHDPAVASGTAIPIVIDDPDNLISRVQTRIGTAGGVVTVCDAGSANGTFVAPPGAQEWTRIGPRPAVLPLGWSLRLGTRVYTHVAADVRPD